MRPRERPLQSRKTPGFLGVSRTLRRARIPRAGGGAQCPRNPEKTRGFRTLEASISVGFQPIRLLLGPLIISARGVEIWTQIVLASTRIKSR